MGQLKMNAAAAFRRILVGAFFAAFILAVIGYPKLRPIDSAEKVRQPYLVRDLEQTQKGRFYLGADDRIWPENTIAFSLNGLFRSDYNERNLQNSVSLANKVYFLADAPKKGPSLWVTDSTTGDTRTVYAFGDQVKNIANLVVAEGKLFFITDFALPSSRLWTSDGTQAGTVRKQALTADSWAFSDDRGLQIVGPQFIPGLSLKVSRVVPWREKYVVLAEDSTSYGAAVYLYDPDNSASLRLAFDHDSNATPLFFGGLAVGIDTLAVAFFERKERGYPDKSFLYTFDFAGNLKNQTLKSLSSPIFKITKRDVPEELLLERNEKYFNSYRIYADGSIQTFYSPDYSGDGFEVGVFSNGIEYGISKEEDGLYGFHIHRRFPRSGADFNGIPNLASYVESADSVYFLRQVQDWPPLTELRRARYEGLDVGESTIAQIGKYGRGLVAYPGGGFLVSAWTADNQATLLHVSKDGSKRTLAVITEGSDGSSPVYLTNIDNKLYFLAQSWSETDGASALYSSDATAVGTRPLVTLRDEKKSVVRKSVYPNGSDVLVLREFMDGSKISKRDVLQISTKDKAIVNLGELPATDAYQTPISLTPLSGGGALALLFNSYNRKICIDGFSCFDYPQVDKELWAVDKGSSNKLLTSSSYLQQVKIADGVSKSKQGYFLEMPTYYGDSYDLIRVGANEESLLRTTLPFSQVLDAILMQNSIVYIAGNGSAFSIWKTDLNGDGASKLMDLGLSAVQLVDNGGHGLFISMEKKLFYMQDVDSAPILVSERKDEGKFSVGQLVTVGQKVFCMGSAPNEANQLLLIDQNNGGAFNILHSFKDPISLVDSAVIDEHLYFRGNDSSHGYELWSSDGTAEGTDLVSDILDGKESSSPSQFLRILDQLYFTARDDENGTELWALDVCPGTLKFNPGICGCNMADTDGDEDGTLDCFDGCPLDPSKNTPGVCGCGVSDVDLNNNGVIDCLEPKSSDATPTPTNINSPKATAAPTVVSGNALSVPKITVVGRNVTVTIHNGNKKSLKVYVEQSAKKGRIVKTTKSGRAVFKGLRVGTWYAYYQDYNRKPLAQSPKVRFRVAEKKK